jgi:hypothetical protein
MAVRLSALGAGRPLLPLRLLVLIFITGWVDSRAIWRLEGLGKLKKSNALIENRTRDLPAFSVVPQPTTLPRAPALDYISVLCLTFTASLCPHYVLGLPACIYLMYYVIDLKFCNSFLPFVHTQLSVLTFSLHRFCSLLSVPAPCPCLVIVSEYSFCMNSII